MKMGSNRRFKRYNVTHCDFMGGNITESDFELKLSSIGLGGCGFMGRSSSEDLVPPKEIICSFFTRWGIRFEESRIVQGNLIYIRPANIIPFTSFLYGVKFFDEERERIGPIIQLLEAWDRKGALKP